MDGTLNRAVDGQWTVVVQGGEEASAKLGDQD